MKTNFVSIIIPCWLTSVGGKIQPEAEAFWFTKHCVERIKKFTQNYELIIVDNGSEVGMDFMREQADIYIRNEKNLGFAPAMNQGFEAANGEWICAMNNDIFVWSGWLEALKQTFVDNQDCGIAMPALMKQTKDGRLALTFDKIDLSLNYGMYGPHAEFGSCWLTKKVYLDKLKEIRGYYFDENFRYGFSEDRDLYKAYRYYLKLETYRTHNTRVFHQGNCSIGKLANRKMYTSANREYLKEKWEKILGESKE